MGTLLKVIRFLVPYVISLVWKSYKVATGSAGVAGQVIQQERTITMEDKPVLKRIQWGALLIAVLAAITSQAQSGAIPPEIAIYVLAATNLLSAILPGVFAKKKQSSSG